MSDSEGILSVGGIVQKRRSPASFLVGYVSQAVLIFLVGQMLVYKAVQLPEPKRYDYTALVSPYQPPQPTPQPTIKIPPPPPQVAPVTAALRAPTIVRKMQPPPLDAPAPVVKIPAPVVPQALVQTAHNRPAAPVVTGGFSSGSSATPTIKAPVNKVQTGGFGDPNGLPGTGDGRGHLIAARLGSFDLPEGPGYGNGSGGARGIRGVVASAGFGNGIATQHPVPGGRGNGNGVQQGSFADTQVKREEAPRQQAATNNAPTTPVEIISKPKPAYTDEARQMKLEGEVLVEVMFSADGRVHALRVVRGLGHGLDQSALHAAEAIKFKPAQREGRAVDSTAVLHVIFELA
jgi:TonB family protein